MIKIVKMTEIAIVNLRYLAESQPSLCIPRVFNNITEHRIRQVFDDLGLGKISRIDIKERKNEKGESFKRVYIHFDKWFWNEDAQAARRKLVSGKEIKIVYDNPWFWKVSASKWAASKDLQEMGAPQRSKAHIDLSDVDEFGRDLIIKKECDERRCNDSRERRDDSRENLARRQDNRRIEKRPEQRDDRRNYKSSPRLPIAPTLQLPIAPTLQLPIAPTLQLKAKKPKTIEPRSPDCSPPRSRPQENPDELTEQSIVKIDYGNNISIPKKRLRFQKKIPEFVETVVEPIVSKDVEVEEREVVDTSVDLCADMRVEDKKEYDELYGDL